MTIDLKSLRKLEAGSPATLLRERAENELVVVIVKLHAGADRPSYIPLRTRISTQLFSSEIPVSDLQRLESDPAVESIALSRSVPVLD
jgi:hypothetical protein